jgi:ribose 1,5-bisphosphokinase
MSDALAQISLQAEAIGPGRLVLVVGPSGAGKDTLLALAKAACAGDDSIVFARRAVTREASSFEDNVQLSDAEFALALARGDFAMHWDAHGHRYALSRSIDDDIRAGRTVVANVSRTVIASTRRAYANVVVIAITAPAEVLAQRLAMRARSTDGTLQDRLARKVADDAAPDKTIVNVSSAEFHARQLVQAIRGGHRLDNEGCDDVVNHHG